MAEMLRDLGNNAALVDFLVVTLEALVLGRNAIKQEIVSWNVSVS